MTEEEQKLKSEATKIILRVLREGKYNNVGLASQSARALMEAGWRPTNNKDERYMVKNDWMTIEEWMKTKNEGKFLGLDLYHVPSGKVFRDFGGAVVTYEKSDNGGWKEVPRKGVYVGRYPYDIVDGRDCLVRPCDKKFQKFHENLTKIKVGDFVRCSGSKRNYRWRKILKIDLASGDIHGQCASQPNEESLAPYASSNGIHTIQEIVSVDLKA